MRSRHRYSGPPSRRCLRAVTWSGRPRPGRGRRPPSRFPSSSGSSAEGGRAEPLALVLVPTRELAVQVSEAMHSYGHDMGARVLPVYGGQPIGRQLRALERGVDVVVATPGRALDHINRGTLNLSGLEVVVLDEADEMLDMGFAEDIEAILGNTPESRQTALFSATMPPRIDGMVRRHLRDPVRVELGRQASASADGLAGAADCLRRAARAQARRSRARARPGGADGHGRLLPYQGRGGPAHRDPERPGLSRRGAARRNGPAAARPGHGPAAQPEPSTFSWPPTWPPAASTSSSSRTW